MMYLKNYKKGYTMKKISVIAALLMLPVASFAASDFNPRFFVEYGINLYSDTSTEYKLDGKKIDSADISDFNNYGSVYVGFDFNGIQIGISPEYSKNETEDVMGASLRAVIPFLTTSVQPYVALELGLANMDYDDGTMKFDDTAFAYGFGAGVKYSFDKHTSIKFGLEYQKTSFETDVMDYEYSVDTDGFTLTTSLAYKF